MTSILQLSVDSLDIQPQRQFRLIFRIWRLYHDFQMVSFNECSLSSDMHCS